MQKLKYTLCLSIIYLMASCGCDFYGSHDLGNNFSLLEGDKLEDRVIVYCAGNKSGCCTGGMSVIPTYEEHYDADGKYLEYVEEAKSNERWIIVKTVQKNNKFRYWLINKDFDIEDKYKDTPLPKEMGKELKKFIESQITGPLSVLEFNKWVKELNINLTFG